MMISKKMNSKLNEQITNEFHAAHLYLAMACSFEQMGYRVLARWFYDQADEERAHGMKLLKYVHDIGGEVELDEIPKPGKLSDSPTSIVKAALDHELKVTQQIHALVELAEEEKDYASRSFLQWFVDEQVEEVSSVSELLQLVEMAGDKYMIQVEARVARMRQAAD